MRPGQIALDLLTAGQTVKPELSRCVRMRFAAADCRRCQRACPQGAISLGPGPTVATERCAGCLLCEAACPAGAFRGGTEKLAEALQALAAVPQPVLGCGAQEGVEAHARVGCLGLLAAEEMLLAVSCLLPDGLTLNLTRCGDCPNGSMVMELKAAMERLGRRLGLGEFTALQLAERDEALHFQEKKLSRRAFFTFFRQKSTHVAAASFHRWQHPPKPLPYSQKKLPPSRALLLSAVPQISPPLRQTIEKRWFPTATFGEDCQQCSGCVGVCPTGALVPPKADGNGPLFEPDHCTGCCLCEIFCSRGGISISKG